MHRLYLVTRLPRRLGTALRWKRSPSAGNSHTQHDDEECSVAPFPWRRQKMPHGTHSPVRLVQHADAWDNATQRVGGDVK